MQIISNIQNNILLCLREVSENNSFYLTGGTALSLFYLKHRQSNDLDFFTTEEELIAPFSQHLQQVLEKKGMRVVRHRGFKSFTELEAFENNESTIIHIALDAPFRFEPVCEFPEYPGVRIDSLVDIASNKLLALFSRAALRDFIDVYFLVKSGKFSTEALFDKAKEKDPGFDLYWLGIAFERINTYDKEPSDMHMLLEPLSFEDLQTFFHHLRDQIIDALKPKQQ